MRVFLPLRHINALGWSILRPAEKVFFDLCRRMQYDGPANEISSHEPLFSLMSDKSHYASGIPSTRWSLIARARDLDPDVQRQALGELFRAYLPALRTHLVRRYRLSGEQAEEIVQGFLIEKAIERDLFSTAAKDKGRLRSLVLRSLQHYFIDWVRKENRKGRRLNEYELVADVSSPESVNDFTCEWARQVLNESMARMRAECKQKGKQSIWLLFEARILTPVLENKPPLGYEALVTRFGFSSPEQAANALVTAKRHFRRVLESVIAQYASDEEVEEEIGELFRVLAAAGPLGVRHGSSGDSESIGSLMEARALDESYHSMWSVIVDNKSQSDRLWSTDELQQLLDHQLKQPLIGMLTSVDKDAASKLEEIREGSSGEPLVTLGDLFRHSLPPLYILDTVKRWARRASRDGNVNLPSSISSLLYFAAIAAALLKHRARITKSDDVTLRLGFQQVLAQSPTDGHLTSLIQLAVSVLAGDDRAARV